MSRRVACFIGNLATFVVVLGLLALHAARHAYPITADARLLWTVAYLCMLLVAVYAVGLPGDTGRRGPILSAVLATGAGAIAISVCQLMAGSALLPRFVVFGSPPIVGAIWAVLGRRVQEHDADASRVSRVVIVGHDREAVALRADLARDAERPAVLVDTISADDVRPISVAEEPLVDEVIDSDASVLVLGRDAQADRLIVSQASTLHESGVRVRTVAQFYEEWMGKLPIAELERGSLMFDISEVHGSSYARVKRLLDVVVGFVGLLPLVLAIPVVWTGNLVANRGPLFYRQERIGRDGKPFSIIKFRTMRQSTDASWTEKNDPRVTLFGGLLRRTHVDELPQFVNIMQGDLSIVGPRPEQPRYVEHLVECLPFYKLRHLVRPGLTGWAQVKFGYAASEGDALEKLQYDFYYLQHQSLGLDCRIVVRTMRTLVGSRGR